MFQSSPESTTPIFNLHYVCCRPLLSGFPDDDRFLGSAHRFCNSMVCFPLCGVARLHNDCAYVLLSVVVTRFPEFTLALAMHRVVAFQSAPGLCPYKDFPAFFEYLAALV